MFITAVDEALRAYLCTRLPLPADAGEVSFETPTPEWSARLTRPTVNLFLHRVDKSDQLARVPQRRFDANGRPERRNASALMVDLTYLVSVWAGDATVEHDLLGRVASLFAATTALPPHSTQGGGTGGSSLVSFGFGDRAASGPLAVAGPLKAYAAVTVTAATDDVTTDESTPAPGAVAAP